MSRDALPPHPHLSQYYPDDNAKRVFLKDIFDDTASDYDRIENLLAIGHGRRYRREAMSRAGLTTGMHALDVAMGTGLVSREAISLVGPGGSVVGLDPSAGMIAQAGELPVQRVLGRGEQLPFASGHFDFLSMGYALRHLSDLNAAFAEFFRVLKPGGRLCLLEISRPEGVLRQQLLKGYFRAVLPILSRFIGVRPQSRKLWQYYWETIDRCVPAPAVLRALDETGFTQTNRNVELGYFSEFTATKPH